MDPEVKAMGEIAQALSTLEPDVAQRVIKWASERYKVQLPASNGKGDGGQGENGKVETKTADLTDFENFHDFFDAANPSSGTEKVLVVGYWYQVKLGNQELDGLTLNSELKNLGHPSTNITRDLDNLIGRTPRLVMQVRKDGTTQQARRKYKLTREGIKLVEKLLLQGKDPE